ncbi:hypothetical protein MHM84_02410 [Halomonas sp. McH1-25]|uniref:hypothetical protein n=1 Tax=unclassified Halomonas TaxID=2609666 RepID=UPI001EF6C865|nr:MULTISPECIES: hypothetical protein [unclassified Halomonas]MCG7598632.1 hypothetical protein [Halomonas sp. McH1-25]MCP1343615.1 hypothetical protein [Halomonas sp. FL8]MCP1363302.1 hypothetical protein [Halomonas sp. BBD45]MCP1364013.1 hypothetical protein [Halomonas sp. BBD48]
MKKSNSTTPNSSEQKMEKLKKEIYEMVKKHPWDYFITLTFKHAINDRIKVNSITRKFINELSIKCFGSRSNKRLRIIPVIENHGFEGLHVHALIENPKERIGSPERKENFILRDSVIEAWIGVDAKTANPTLSCFEQDEWIKKIYDTEGLVNYLLKQLSAHPEAVQWDLYTPEGRK